MASCDPTGVTPSPPRTAVASGLHSNRPSQMAPARTGSKLARLFEPPACHSNRSNLPGRCVRAPADAAAGRRQRIPGALGAGQYRPAVARREGWDWIISALTLAAAGLVSAEFLFQISEMTREQLAELALIPGLGTPTAQRRALFSAVLLQPLLWPGIVFLLGLASLLFKGAPLSMIEVLAECSFIIWLTYLVFALEKLLVLPSRVHNFFAELMKVYLYVFFVYPSWNSHSFVRLFHMHWWLWSVPILLAGAIASVIGLFIRQLTSAPHPFLVQRSRGLSARLEPIWPVRASRR